MTEQLNSNNKGFTGGPVAKTLPANAGDVASIPGPVRVHMPRGDRTCVPRRVQPREPVLCNKRSHLNEKLAHQLESSSRSSQPEKVQAQQRRPSIAREKKRPLVAQWWGLGAYIASAHIQSLVGELNHVAKKKKRIFGGRQTCEQTTTVELIAASSRARPATKLNCALCKIEKRHPL